MRKLYLLIAILIAIPAVWAQGSDMSLVVLSLEGKVNGMSRTLDGVIEHHKQLSQELDTISTSLDDLKTKHTTLITQINTNSKTANSNNSVTQTEIARLKKDIEHLREKLAAATAQPVAAKPASKPVVAEKAPVPAKVILRQ